MNAPVTNEASADNQNAQAFAISFGLAGLPIGIRSFIQALLTGS